eukprot:TRINITY_DN20384_c0_g1_i1.p2 TRINITY_DN20384_c0_g1~~TRINITY_DN20384_c0_g1_i1.p2  ORF type:complete len:145 (+),score=28.70 TRINITY_DN20384_c0_g1_i1:629-1063(+)
MCKALQRPGWLTDLRFKDAAGLALHRGDRLDMIAAAVRPFSSEQVLRALEAEQVPCGVVNTRLSLLKDPQLAANCTVMTAEHPIAGAMVFPRPAARFESPFQIRHHAPAIGEHTVEILRGVGYSSGEIASLQRQGVIRADGALH